MKNILNEALKELKDKRPFFVSEDDFKLALMIQLSARLGDERHSVRLEKLVETKYYFNKVFSNKGTENRSIYLDAFTQYKGLRYAFELKYKTKGCILIDSGEKVELKKQLAYDVARYKFRLDIKRIEQLIVEGKIHEGFAIFLTNDKSYWNLDYNENNQDGQFRFSNRIAIDAKWNLKEEKLEKFYIKDENDKWVSKNKKIEHWIHGKEFTHDLKLKKEYRCYWENYSNISGEEFKILVINIT